MSGLYAPAQIVTDPSDCFWYHVMDLPEIGTVQGAWDLRETIDDYLGHVDFTGMRCLDIGAASGYLSFEMERRGAMEVVSVDLDPATHAWEIVPFAGRDLDQARGQMAQDVRAWQRAYWLAHRLLGFDINLPKGDGRYAALRLCHQFGAALDPRDVESSLAEPLGELARSTRHIKARPQPT